MLSRNKSSSVTLETRLLDTPMSPSVAFTVFANTFTSYVDFAWCLSKCLHKYSHLRGLSAKLPGLASSSACVLPFFMSYLFLLAVSSISSVSLMSHTFLVLRRFLLLPPVRNQSPAHSFGPINFLFIHWCCRLCFRWALRHLFALRWRHARRAHAGSFSPCLTHQ